MTEPMTELERLLAASLWEIGVEQQWEGKFVRHEDIPSDYLLAELHAELEKVVTTCE